MKARAFSRAARFSSLVTSLVLGTSVTTSCGSSSGSDDTLCPDGTGPFVHDRETIETNTTWKAGCGSHVIVGHTFVRGGATLTIEPGARIELAKDAIFEVGSESETAASSLIAKGTAAKPITFTRNESDRWGFLLVQYPGTGAFEHVVVEGGGSEYPNGGYASLIVRGDYELPPKEMATLSHVTIRDSLGPGLWLRESGVLTPDSTDLTVTKCGKADGTDKEPFPVVIPPSALSTFPVGNYTGNNIDELLVNTNDTSSGIADVVVDVTIHERGVPYRVGAYAGDTLRFGTDEQHPKVTLTIEPGVTLRFPVKDEATSGRGIELTNWTSTTEAGPPGTTIKAVGTTEKPIVFTSAAASPKAGDWRGIWFGTGANADNQVEHVVIEYAGSDLLAGGFACPVDHSNDGAIAILGGPAANQFLKNSVIRHSAAAGIVKGWNADEGADVDFLPTNTFEDIAECKQTVLHVAQGDCPDVACE